MTLALRLRRLATEKILPGPRGCSRPPGQARGDGPDGSQMASDSSTGAAFLFKVSAA